MYLVKVFAISILIKMCTAHWPSDLPTDSEQPYGEGMIIINAVPVDHFNPHDDRAWPLLTYVDTRYYKDGGPTYLVTSPPDSRSKFPQLVYELAAKTHGTMIMILGHRMEILYQYNPDYLKYLTTQQVLADMAYIVNDSRLKLSNHSKVVAVGKGFGATLAVWLRQLYPDRFDMAIADSAHLLAKFEVPEYLEKVTDLVKKVETPDCVKKISDHFTRLDNLFNTPDGIEDYRIRREVCEGVDLTDRLNQQYYMYTTEMENLLNNILNNDYPDTCKIMNTPSLDNKYCRNDSFETLVDGVYNDTKQMSLHYMKCNELGWFITSSQNQIFSKRLVKDYYVNWCDRLYGFNEKELLQKMEDTNKMYGGLRPNVTQVFFAYGGKDPHLSLGPTEDLSPDAPVFIIPDYPEDGFLDHYLYNDEAKKALEHLFKMVSKWLGL